jgi:integrase
MGVKVRERHLASGDVAFYIDTYHRDFGRFSQKTGLQVNPKNRKEYRDTLAEAKDKARLIEKALLSNPASVFGRKSRSADNFIDYYKSFAERVNGPRYKNVIPILRDFIGPNLPFSSLNSAWLERFKSHLEGKESICANTADGYLSSMKTVIRKAYKEGFIPEDFTVKVSGIQKEDVERSFLTIEQIDGLYKARCNNQMLKQAFLFACFVGFRISDIERITWEQISLINGRPYFQFKQRKGARFENMPLSDQAVKILQETRALHPEYAPEGDDRVFILPSRSRISVLLETWGVRAGLPFHLTFHVSRHTFATMNLTYGSDLYTVSKLLGHKNIKTTQVYGHIIDQKKLDAVQALPVISAHEEATSGLPEDISSTAQISEGKYPGRKGEVSTALEVKGDRIAAALELKKNKYGRYEFKGKEYSAIELALELSGT